MGSWCDLNKHKHKHDDSLVILNLTRSSLKLLRLRMPNFPRLVSPCERRETHPCAYACAYRTSGNRGFKVDDVISSLISSFRPTSQMGGGGG